jgi:glutathione S-transferase
MDENAPLLWHIPLSHFSKKARWALDYKRIAHRRKVLGADYLIRAWRATGHGTLPILFLDGRAIGDSTHIIARLEERYPDHLVGEQLHACINIAEESIAPCWCAAG